MPTTLGALTVDFERPAAPSPHQVCRARIETGRVTALAAPLLRLSPVLSLRIGDQLSQALLLSHQCTFFGCGASG